MLEAIRIRKAGYAIRIELDEFVKRYKPVYSQVGGGKIQASSNKKT
jgi:myosin heavy subunit